MDDPLRHHKAHDHLGPAFGGDTFGRVGEKLARSLGTSKYIVSQTIAVVVWIIFNAVGFIHHWDPYPFILLNLAFSTQAAYASPFILLAQTRQADRDKANTLADAVHREEVAKQHATMIAQNTTLTEEVKVLIEANTSLTEEIASMIRQPKDNKI